MHRMFPLQRTLRLRAERKRLGWSLRELGERAGVDYQKISLIERGLMPLYPAWADRLASALGIPSDKLTQPVRAPRMHRKRGGRR